jgi:spermidine/putrescine transport system ATP-binding protein
LTAAASAPAAADLEVRQLSKRFAEHRAVEELSFSVAHGSFFSILGPSGCGKTTLLRMIAGFIQPDTGEIVIGGRSMTQVAPNRRPVNMVFQHLALFPMMSVLQNVAFGLARRGVARAERLKRAAAMLERVGLAGAGNKRTEELSGGQRQRVAIARSLVLEPTLLLLDEPLGALDLKLREHMKLELKQLQSAFGTTFVYITHDQSEALVLSDRVAVMHAGRFEQIGTPQELYYAPASAFVAGFVGANNRLRGTVASASGALAAVTTTRGLTVSARRHGELAPGAAAELFIRPEGAALARAAGDLPPGQMSYRGEVVSLMFDGANSAVLLREAASGHELRIALPQTGAYADVRPGMALWFALDPQRVMAFAAAVAHG